MRNYSRAHEAIFLLRFEKYCRSQNVHRFLKWEHENHGVIKTNNSLIPIVSP